MKPNAFILLLLAAGCGRQQAAVQTATTTLVEARQGFQTRLVRQVADGSPVQQPPAELFEVVRYDAAVGKLAAYVSRPPADGQKHPAMIWIFGGFNNSIDGTAWDDATPDNDQSARAFREAGIVMMYPSLRGGNDNPGHHEAFYGEVDDVLAAADYLARQEFVDPQRIYLGGHSTGGTLVLLVAAASNRFRAAFSFGPADEVGGYGPDVLPFDISNDKELLLRGPIHWLHCIARPVFVFEGTEQGNLDALQAMARASSNPSLHFYPVQGGDHFSILAPVTRLIAGKIVADNGPACNLAFTEQELSGTLISR